MNRSSRFRQSTFDPNGFPIVMRRPLSPVEPSREVVLTCATSTVRHEGEDVPAYTWTVQVWDYTDADNETWEVIGTWAGWSEAKRIAIATWSAYRAEFWADSARLPLLVELDGYHNIYHAWGYVDAIHEAVVHVGDDIEGEAWAIITMREVGRENETVHAWINKGILPDPNFCG